MYCQNCGTQLPEGANVCPKCAGATEFRFSNQSNTADGVYYTPNQNSNNAYNNSYNQGYDYNNYSPNSYSSYNDRIREFKDNLSSANTLGILAIVLGLVFTPIVGIILGILGMNKANSVPDLVDNPQLMADKSKAKTLNLLGIILPLIIFVLIIVVAFVMFAIFGMTAVGAASYF